MKDKYPTVSIVVPVYNEKRFIASCLKAIKLQTIKAKEIIIVDNNSTDDTVSIAKKFKGIKIVNENRQGISFARAKGIDEATGDFVVRIDADTILPKDYVKNLKNLIKNNRKISGFTGYGVSSFEAIPHTSKMWSWLYFNYTKAYLGHQVMWGSNMAIRKKSWQQLKKYLVNDDDLVHEDQDISLALASIGGKIMLSTDLNVMMTMEEVQHFNKYHKYVRMLRNTKKIDKESPRYKLESRLPPLDLIARAKLWLASAWSVYVFYFITILYSGYLKFKHFIVAH